MAGISNSRHTILTDVPRVLFTGTKRIAVVADTTSFSSTAGVPTPSAITLTANLFGVSGTINWTVPYGTATLSSGTGASVTLTFGDMVSKVVTVRASITVVGVTYTSDITLTKTEDGVSGADSKYVVVNTSGYVFAREDEYNVYVPLTINLSYTAYGGTVSSSTWEYFNGSSWQYISGASSINVSQAEAFTNSRTYRITLVIDGVSVTDEVTLTKLTGGTDALSGYLTNESITFATDSLGTTPPNIATLTAGTFKVYYGTTDITGGCTFSKTDVNCTTSITNGTGTYSASAVTADSATSTIIATHTSTGLQVTKVLSLSKSRVGVAGTNGINGVDGATGLTGAATDIVFRRAATQPSTPTSTFNPPTVPDTWYTNVNSVPASANPMWSSVGKLPAGSSTWTWQVPIQVEGTAGADGSDANIVSEIYVYKESLSAPLTPTGGTYDFSTNTFSSLPSGWVGSMPVVGTLPIYQSAAVASAPTGGSDSTLTWSSPVKIYENADDGIDAKLMSLSVNSQVFQINKAGVATPTSISIKAIRNNITGATFSVIDGTATLTSISGDNATLLYTNMTSDSVTIKVVDASTAYEDTITIVKVREGSDALVGYLTNENVTLPAQTDGTVVSYTGASGKFIVLRGATDVTDQCNFAVLSNPNSLTPTGSIVTSGTNAGDYMITGGFTTDVASVTYRATYVFNSLTYYVDKIFTLSKSKTGTTGAVGSAGSSARIAYVKLQPPPIGTDPTSLSATPSTQAFTGDVLPTTGTWGESNAWLSYPPSIVAGEQVWQTTGIYNYLTNQTTWVAPYLSNLKVGNLSAITINTGTLTVDASGYVRGGQTGYNTGTGFWLGYDGSAYKFSIGSATQSLTWNGSTLTLKGNLQVNDAALSGTTMTGSGAQFNAAGTFALGTAANNITYNGTDLTMNGTVNLTGTLTFRRSANSYLALGQAASSVVASHGDAGAQALVGLVSAGASAKGVYGLSTNAASYGVYGESATGVGVFGLTTSNKALQGVSVTSAGYSAHLNGKVGLTTAYSPLELNSSQGTTGQTLISQGSGNTPAWGDRIAGGAVTTDGSGNATISVVMGRSDFGFNGTTTSGANVTITSVTNTGGNNYDVVIQTQYCTTGAAYPSRGVRWTAIG